MSSKIFLASFDFSSAKNMMKWLVTDNEDVAKQFDTYQLASIDDLHDWMAVSGEIFTNSSDSPLKLNFTYFKKSYFCSSALVIA